MNMPRVGIVGAGPAGIMAALEAASRGAEVHLFDSNAAVGRKLLVTGNGRCNLSNVEARPSAYVCAAPDFLETALRLYGHAATVARLQDFGILTYATPDGWCYPVSNSAATVVDSLTTALKSAGVEIHLQARITRVHPCTAGVTLGTDNRVQTWSVDRAIIATGGKAYPELGSTGEMFPQLQSLGHTITPLQPALVPLTAHVKHLHALQGVRLDVGLTLCTRSTGSDQADCPPLGKAVGNLMFTQFGFSGPAPMNLSHLVSTRSGTRFVLDIDLVPHYRRELIALLGRRSVAGMPLVVILASVMPPKLPPVLLRLAGLPAGVRVMDVSDLTSPTVLDRLTHLTAEVIGTRGFHFAQVSTGGVPVSEVDPCTMASRRVPGLYLAGEVLDVVGPCGGYNLQFAFTTGALAGAGATSSSTSIN